MKRIFLLIASTLAVIGVEAQTVEFMKLYEAALATFDTDKPRTEGDAAVDADEGIVTSEFSGRMLRTIMPDKGNDKRHMVNRIDMIRQIKFPHGDESDLFRRLQALAASERYERLSIMNVDGESVYIYTAPYKDSGSEFLILIAKDDSRLACDIVGRITLKDVLDLLFGRA